MKILKSLIVASSLFLSFSSHAATFQEPTNFEALYGHKAETRLQDLNQLIVKYKNSSDIVKVEKVNDFFNEFERVSDQKVWHKHDYWTTTLEFVGAGMGDCEDFSIAKYQTLEKMGVKESRLKIIYGLFVTRNKKEAHAYVGYTVNNQTYILDSNDADVELINQRYNLVSVYAFNKTSLWLAEPNGTFKYEKSSRCLSMFFNVENRKTLRKPFFKLDLL